jgi:non-ribosomal peptide synthetase component F
VTLAAFAQETLPFDLLVEMLRPERGTGQIPLAQTVFSFRQKGNDTLPLKSLEASGFDFGQAGRTKFDLFLQMSDQANVLGSTWEYDAALFESRTIEEMNNAFVHLLENIVRDPNLPIDSLRAVPEEMVVVLRQKIGVKDLVLEDFSF